MKTYTQQQVAWCSSPSTLIEFRNCSEENKFQYLAFTEEGLDMSKRGWIPVGTVVRHCLIEDDLAVTAAALSVIKKAEETIRAEAQRQLTTLASVRQNLLALEAPKRAHPPDELFAEG